MADPRDLLDRAAVGLELRPQGWDRMLELAHRRQRRRRLFARALALILCATSGAGLWAAFQGTPQTVGGVSNHEAVARLDRAISSVESTSRRVRLELQRDAESLHSTEADVSRLEGQLGTIGSSVQQAQVQAQIQLKSAHVAELRAHIRQLQDELSAATSRLSSLKIRKAELTFPRGGTQEAAPAWTAWNHRCARLRGSGTARDLRPRSSPDCRGWGLRASTRTFPWPIARTGLSSE